MIYVILPMLVIVEPFLVLNVERKFLNYQKIKKHLMSKSKEELLMQVEKFTSKKFKKKLICK